MSEKVTDLTAIRKARFNRELRAVQEQILAKMDAESATDLAIDRPGEVDIEKLQALVLEHGDAEALYIFSQHVPGANVEALKERIEKLDPQRAKTWEFCEKYTTRVSDNPRIAKAVESATNAFWQSVGEHFPEAKTSDMAHADLREVNEVLTSAVELWVEYNVPQSEKSPDDSSDPGM